MAKSKIQETSRLIAAAMAISAAGLFTATGPAQALPPVPLAPGNCQAWGFNGTTAFKQATGESMVFESANQVASGPSTWYQPNGAKKTGNVTGTIDPNGQVNVSWYNADSRVEFVGTVGSDGYARGTRPGNDAPVSWNSSTPMQCMKEDKPAAQANSAEVTGDVEVYDVPGGVGTVIGTLEGGEGQRVQLGSGCKEDRWCNIVWPAGPGGTAWVWGDFLK